MKGEANCQPSIHQLPPGTVVNYVGGNMFCACGGATRIANEPVRLGEHLDKPSGHCRLLYFINPFHCSLCRQQKDYIEFPCGVSPLEALFAQVPAEVNDGRNQ